VRATIVAGLDPAAGAERLIYGALAAVSLVGAVFAAGKLLQGLAERRDVQRGHYRRGLHVLGRDGLLIAGRDHHTWVPRGMLPEPVKVTSGSGESVTVTYVYTLVDDEGRADRLECSTLENTALWMWQEHGHLPEGGGWT
jgi:hypothetical protein